MKTQYPVFISDQAIVQSLLPHLLSCLHLRKETGVGGGGGKTALSSLALSPWPLLCSLINTWFYNMFTSIRKVPHILLEIISAYLQMTGSPVGLIIKNPPATQEKQEIWVQSLGQEDPLEEEMANHSSTLTWRIPGTEEPGGLQSMGLQKSQTQLSIHSMPSNNNH